MSEGHREYKPVEYEVIEIIKRVIATLEEYSAEELQELRSPWLAEAEQIGKEPALTRLASDLIDRVIRSKLEGVDVI